MNQELSTPWKLLKRILDMGLAPTSIPVIIVRYIVKKANSREEGVQEALDFLLTCKDQQEVVDRLITEYGAPENVVEITDEELERKHQEREQKLREIDEYIERKEQEREQKKRSINEEE